MEKTYNPIKNWETSLANIKINQWQTQYTSMFVLVSHRKLNQCSFFNFISLSDV